jgi:isopentenyl-diphosphate delta-isomerase
MSSERKKDHIRICVEENVQYTQNTGFNQFSLKHNALPELSLEEIDTSICFLGNTFSAPIMISSMTGGCDNGGEINKQLARIANTLNLPMGLGSQRVMVDQPEALYSFAVVREVAPTAWFAANIGGAQLAEWNASGLLRQNLSIIIESVSANALIVHLNPLQELVQPEGDTNFSGIADAITQTKILFPTIPLIVKETGAGISDTVAFKLKSCGVDCIDVAGAGGTSWAKVEYLRRIDTAVDDSTLFGEWGITTVKSINMIRAQEELNDLPIIASGGVYTAIDCVKSLCLGANMTAMATPIIKILVNEGEQACLEFLKKTIQQLKIALCLIGVKQLKDLNTQYLIRN